MSAERIGAGGAPEPQPLTQAAPKEPVSPPKTEEPSALAAKDQLEPSVKLSFVRIE